MYNFDNTKDHKRPRVLVAMSGGVDSSVAAALLVEQGYDVIGVTMQVWDYSANQCATDEGNGTCCSSQDVDDARAVADHLNIPFYVINCEEKFKATVIDDFIDTYLKGETPIPCVNCNTFLKFDHLIKKMEELNCDYLATGHYARIVESKSGRPSIVTSSDSWKDQTYFLFTLDPQLVSRLIFPVGAWQKPELRAYAEKTGLPVARKKDSTGICFVGRSGYAGFIKDNVAPERLVPGVIRHYPSGDILGKHSGIQNFTVGQRKGVGIAVGSPLYVIKIEAESATVWMGDDCHLYSSELWVRDLNWLDQVEDGTVIQAKIRYAHRGSSAKIFKAANGKVRLNFDEPQRAVTAGQAAVLYRDGQLLGGGWICQ